VSDRAVQILREEEEALLRKLELCRSDIAEISGDAAEDGPVSAVDWCGEDLGSFNWLIRGVVPREGVVVMCADAGIGKTTLICQMTICLSRGVPFIGFEVDLPAPTLTIAAEGSRLAFRNRFMSTCRALQVDMGGLAWYVQPDRMTDYMIGSAKLDRMIARSGAKLVVLDTIGYFHTGDENDANDWKRYVMRPLRGLIAKYGCSFVLVHHHSKGADRHGWQKGRGTTAMYADCDVWMRLEKAEGYGDDARDLHIDKNKYGRMGFFEPLRFRSTEAVFEAR
jgi:RecA-family ATPase